eukprot:gene10647-11804_t
MGNVFNKEKPLKEIVRENQRLIKKSVRELEREIKTMETNLKKLEADIKKNAKANQMNAVKIMVKDYVRTKNYITRFIEMKTHLNAVSLKIQTVKSHDAMAQAMKGVTQALGKMNKKINLPGLQKIMAEFLKENERGELTQEMMGDTIDDALEEEGSAEEESLIINQVLDELGVNTAAATPAAPQGAIPVKAEAKEEAAPDPAVSDLEARIANLRSP